MQPQRKVDSVGMLEADQLDFTGGIYRSTGGKIVRLHSWLPKLQLWYGLWISQQKVVYFDKLGVCNVEIVGKIDIRKRGSEKI